MGKVKEEQKAGWHKRRKGKEKIDKGEKRRRGRKITQRTTDRQRRRGKRSQSWTRWRRDKGWKGKGRGRNGEVGDARRGVEEVNQ